MREKSDGKEKRMKGQEMWKETEEEIESLKTDTGKTDGLMDGVVRNKGGKAASESRDFF